MITKDFLELCLSPRVEEPKSEVKKPFVPEQPSPPVFVFTPVSLFEYVFVFCGLHMYTRGIQHYKWMKEK